MVDNNPMEGRDAMRLIPAKTVISKNKSPDSWFGHDYNMNLYKGCCHGCIYCDSRSDCYRVENFDEVRAKEKALEIVNLELKARKKNGIVGTGAMSDPYNPFERKYKLTRGALELLNTHGFGVALATKSDLVVRDIDVLKSIAEHSPVCIKITITTCDDELCRKVEPYTASAAARFEAVEKLADSGLFCGILLMPVLPFINDNAENITNIVKKASEAGARFIFPMFGVTLRQNQRDYYYQQLDKHFPGLKRKYQTLYGDSYVCRSVDANRLYGLFTELCESYGILYNMPDIISAYKMKNKNTQISLFDHM